MIPENEGKIFVGPIQPGEVRNPRGNPNMKLHLTPKHQTGPTSIEGRFRAGFSKLQHGRNSKLIAKMRWCDRCPFSL